jgi:signal peptide peptidase SppA
VAILPLDGITTKRAGLFADMLGMVSTQQFQLALQAALADSDIHSLLLLIDSPGGTVDGTAATAQAVRAARNYKPVVAIADGQMLAAAYWIGSAANKVFLSSDTTAVGSIGVAIPHVDRSGADRQRGVKITEITAGKYKRIASEHAPLTPAGFTSLKEIADHIYSIFVQDVALNRGIDTETVLGQMAEGRIFVGRKAVAAGLADGISTLPAIVAMLNGRAAATKPLGVVGAHTSTPRQQIKLPMTASAATIVRSDFGSKARQCSPSGSTETAATQPFAGRNSVNQKPEYNPQEIARLAQDYQLAEATAGRFCSFATAVHRVTNPKEETPEAIARRAQDFQRNMAAKGKRISVSEAVAAIVTP